jgi:hypothetical protein
LTQAFLDAHRQFCQESDASGAPLKKSLSNRLSPARDQLELLFSTGKSSLLSAVNLESDSNCRQIQLLTEFAKAPARRPARNSRGPSTAQSQIVSDITRLLGLVAGIRQDAARDLIGIGSSMAAMAFSYDSRTVGLPADGIEAELSKLRQKCQIEKSADVICEADDDDFIVVEESGAAQPRSIAVDALLVDEDAMEEPASRVAAPAEEGEWPLSAEDSARESSVWPIMEIEPKATRIDTKTEQPQNIEADDDLDGFWDGLLQAPPAVDPLSALMEEAVEQQLKKRDVGTPPSPPAGRRPGESSRMDEEWTNLQLSLSKKPPEQQRQPKKNRGPKSPP